MKKGYFKYFIIGILLIVSLNIQAQQKSKLIAYVILNTECPISQNIVPIFEEIKIKYPIVDFISVFSNWDSKKQIELFKNKYNLDTKIIHDKKHILIKYLKASRTPEVFLINSKKQIIYKGAINNQYATIGLRKQGKVTCYLEDAINDYILYGYVKTFETNAVGCKIEPLRSYDKSHL